MIETLTPALIYVCLLQIVIDTFKGLYTVAFFKFWVTLYLRSYLTYCVPKVRIISWLIVFIPFVDEFIQ